MKKLMLLILPLIGIQFYCQSQTLIVNGQPIDPEKYDEYNGSAYLFKDWVKAYANDNNGEAYEDIFININGVENEIEITEDKKTYIYADPKLIPEIVIEDKQALEELDMEFLSALKFIRKPNAKLPLDFYLELFKNGDYHLLYEFSVSQSTIVQRPPGKIIEVKKLNKNPRMILISTEGQQALKLNKKEIKKSFAKVGDITSWAKSNKLKVDSYECLVKYLEHIESK